MSKHACLIHAIGRYTEVAHAEGYDQLLPSVLCILQYCYQEIFLQHWNLIYDLVMQDCCKNGPSNGDCVGHDWVLQNVRCFYLSDSRNISAEGPEGPLFPDTRPSPFHFTCTFHSRPRTLISNITKQTSCSHTPKNIKCVWAR